MISFHIETLEEFETRHSASGFPKIYDAKNMSYLFSDGASMPDELPRDPIMAQPHLHEPASDTEQQLKDRKRYFRLALDQAEREFNALRTNLADAAFMASKYANLPLPPKEAKAALLHAKLSVETIRAELEKIDAEINHTPSGQRRQQILDDQAARSRAASELGREFMSVTL